MSHLPADTCSVTELRRHTSAVIERARSTGGPLLITRRGRGIAVLLDIATYERFVEASERLRELCVASARGKECAG